MQKDKSYCLKLIPKKSGGKGKSKLDFLIEQFMLFKAGQLKFNEFVLEQFKKHSRIK